MFLFVRTARKTTHWGTSWDRELGTGNWGQGTWDRELGTGNWGQGTGGSKLGTGNLGQGTGDRELGQGLGTGNWGELGAANWEQGTWEGLCGCTLQLLHFFASTCLSSHVLYDASIVRRDA